MGKNPCKLCGTPGTEMIDGSVECLGCGSTPAKDVLALAGRKHKKMAFYDAADKYEKSGYQEQGKSFGQWLADNDIDLLGKQ